MANEILFDENPNGKFLATLDRTAGRRYSVLGPMDDNGETDLENGHYKAWDHEEAEELGTGTRDEMLKVISEAPDDHLS